MNVFTNEEMLLRLGKGEPIASVCSAAGLTREEFGSWWRNECRRRVPADRGRRHFGSLAHNVEIRRDRWGIPHVKAGNDADLFFGFGYATAQDRLFQLEYLRRKARGTLAEILGPRATESDTLYRTIGLAAIADAEWASLPQETRLLLTAYSDGINALIAESLDNLPVEFSLLDYQPDRWAPTDSLVITGEFRWYLTGRFPIIMIPELAKRHLGDGPLYNAYLQGEADEESILPRNPASSATRSSDRVGSTVSDPGEGHGSNNWVVSSARSATGKPLLASDPHVPFGAVSIWQEIHLQGGSFNVVGAALAGMPAIMVGRNPQVAWGITNNICSQRDLYLERIDSAQPDCFLFDGEWEPASRREEVINIHGADSQVMTVRSSRNGPIIDHLLPPKATEAGPVSVRWLGKEACGWIPALLDMDRARSCEEFRTATKPWLVPTFNLVFADSEGHIGHQTTGRIPLREVATRGYRPGWDPRHQWKGLTSWDDLPSMTNPSGGLIVTANNRLAPDDYPIPLSGTWSSGYRARRIRRQLTDQTGLTLKRFQRLQQDVFSERAEDHLPHLLRLLDGETDPRVIEAIDVLKAWDCRSDSNSVAATLFNVFFEEWCRTVMAERVPSEDVELLAAGAGGLSAALLIEDQVGWFSLHQRQAAVRKSFHAAIDRLSKRFGPAIGEWTWGRLHTLVQKHFLSGHGDLGVLLDRSGLAMSGDGHTVSSSTPDANFGAWLGAGYRMVADLADPRQGIYAVEIGSTSGHPGSPHYDDQLALWSDGGYHYLALQNPEESDWAVLHLQPEAP